MEHPENKFNTRQILQRKPSFTIDKTDTIDDDTFDHILHVTSDHEAVMAYYYLDENNKVQFWQFTIQLPWSWIFCR